MLACSTRVRQARLAGTGGRACTETLVAAAAAAAAAAGAARPPAVRDLGKKPRKHARADRCTRTAAEAKSANRSGAARVFTSSAPPFRGRICSAVGILETPIVHRAATYSSFWHFSYNFLPFTSPTSRYYYLSAINTTLWLQLANISSYN